MWLDRDTLAKSEYDYLKSAGYDGVNDDDYEDAVIQEFMSIDD